MPRRFPKPPKRTHPLTQVREGYGDRDIEDLWTDFFSVSADLTAGEARVHSAGSLWTAVRASVAVPGVFPPIDAGDGHLLVDGGVLDNVPTSPMRDPHNCRKCAARRR